MEECCGVPPGAEEPRTQHIPLRSSCRAPQTFQRWVGILWQDLSGRIHGGGDGVIAVSSMSLVKSSLMCIPEPASNAQTQSSSLPLVSSNQSLQQDPSSSFPSGDLSGLCQGCSAATTDVQCLLWTSSQRIKASGPPMGVGWADGQPSPQDARPLQCLLLKYPQLQRKKTNKPGKTQRKSRGGVNIISYTGRA